MPRVALFAGGDRQSGFDLFVGVDHGAFYFISGGLPLDLAVGDFDSVSTKNCCYIKDGSHSGSA